MIRKKGKNSNSSKNGFDQSRITNHKSLSTFSGNWLVNYDPKEFKYPEILIALAKIQDYFQDKNIEFDSINVFFNKDGTNNEYSKIKGDLFLFFCGLDKKYVEKSAKSWPIAILKPLEKHIQTISLLFPRLDNDPRWKTIGLTAGQLFLASNLKASGFGISPELITISSQNRPSEALSSDMTGISLFEDLLPLLRPFLGDFRASYKGILAAGGPFPTLSPLAAIYHLPQVNLFVRGEAELVLPRALEALNRGDLEAFFSLAGVFWQQPGLIAMAGFDTINRPDDLSPLAVDLGFLRDDHIGHGLEMNFSRGCARGCMFCCHTQGTRLRKLPLDKAEEILEKYSERTAGARSPMARTVNINDDDILQDPEYAREIFALIKKRGFRIFGIQTSTASLAKSDGKPDQDVLDLVTDPELYVENRPLLWLGTDTFLEARARRLGKRLPSRENFRELLSELEKRGLRHFHYWISSDGDSTWEEFVEELALIFSYFRDFPNFSLLAHAPFTVPYPASRMFARIAPGEPRLKLKLELTTNDPRFSSKIVERMETSWPQLNDLLKNEKAGGEKGFFDLLKEKDLMAAAQLAYHFLKQEEFQNQARDPKLLSAREKLGSTISELLEIQGALKVKGKR